MSVIRYDFGPVRRTQAADLDDVMALLSEVALEIPVRLDGRERQAKMLQLVRDCCSGLTSWVALGAEGRIVGFLLAKRVEEGNAHTMTRLARWTGAPGDWLELLYGGVSTSERGRKHFSVMLHAAKALGMPLSAEIEPGNRGGMADRLSRAGFRYDLFRWYWLPSRTLIPAEPRDMR